LPLSVSLPVFSSLSSPGTIVLEVLGVLSDSSNCLFEGFSGLVEVVLSLSLISLMSSSSSSSWPGVTVLEGLGFLLDLSNCLSGVFSGLVEGVLSLSSISLMSSSSSSSSLFGVIVLEVLGFLSD
jgi:hypothetical protein